MLKPLIGLGYRGYYASDRGTIWSKRRGALFKLKPKIDGFGYHRVCVTREDKKQEWRFVHVLVLEAFIGPPPKGMECRHFPDRDPGNNRLTNLSWGTRSQNQRDRVHHGTSSRGEQNARVKLSETQVLTIRKLEGRFTKSKIARMFGVGRTTIRNILSGERWGWLVD